MKRVGKCWQHQLRALTAFMRAASIDHIAVLGSRRPRMLSRVPTMLARSAHGSKVRPGRHVGAITGGVEGEQRWRRRRDTLGELHRPRFHRGNVG